MRLLVLLLLVGPAAAQYSTRFDDDTGWTFTSNHAVYTWAVDDDPPGHWLSHPTSLNITYAEGEVVDATATSPAIDLAPLAAPELAFWTKADMAEDACLNDNRTLVIRDDVTGQVLLWYCLSKRVPSGQPYVEYRVPLDPAWGVVRVQFDFFSVDGFANFGDGWFVDNLSVREGGCPPPLYYCWGYSNSVSSAGAMIHALGSTSVAANDLTLQATTTIPGEFGIFFFGPGTEFAPLGSGVLCVDGPHVRLATVATGAGSPTFAVDYATPPADQLVVGSTWYFQFWYRDPGFAGPSNTTDAVALTFCP